MKTFILAFLLILAGCMNREEHQSMTAVRLDVPGGTCSGTVVAPTVILSAGHCFEEDDGGQATSMLVDGYKVKILAVVFDGNDHALVQVDYFFQHWAIIGTPPAPGARVHYWGNPAGIPYVYREGYVTHYHLSTMMMDINGFFGDSGSGIFDDSGYVVGVISFINPNSHEGLVFSLMGANALEFTPLQYEMMGVRAP